MFADAMRLCNKIVLETWLKDCIGEERGVVHVLEEHIQHLFVISIFAFVSRFVVIFHVVCIQVCNHARVHSCSTIGSTTSGGIYLYPSGDDEGAVEASQHYQEMKRPAGTRKRFAANSKQDNLFMMSNAMLLFVCVVCIRVVC